MEGGSDLELVELQGPFQPKPVCAHPQCSPLSMQLVIQKNLLHHLPMPEERPPGPLHKNSLRYLCVPSPQELSFLLAVRSPAMLPARSPSLPCPACCHSSHTVSFTFRATNVYETGSAIINHHPFLQQPSHSTWVLSLTTPPPQARPV